MDKKRIHQRGESAYQQEGRETVKIVNTVRREVASMRLGLSCAGSNPE